MRLVYLMAVVLATSPARASTPRPCCGPPSQDTGVPSSTGQDATQASVEEQADLEQMLRESLELLHDGDVQAALRAMQFTVLRAPAAARTRLDERCAQWCGLRLAELLARTRIEAAVTPDGAFRLRYATPFERPVLGRVMRDLQEQRLARRYGDYTVAEWTQHREEYGGLRPDTRELVADASRAAALIGARLRFDPALENQAEERVRLFRLRADLARLASLLMQLPGYTAPRAGDGGGTDPAEQVRRRLLEGQGAQPAAGEAPTAEATRGRRESPEPE